MQHHGVKEKNKEIKKRMKGLLNIHVCSGWLFVLDILPQSRSFVPSNRPSGAGDFAHNTIKMRGGGGRGGGGGGVGGGGGHQPAAASASGCGSTQHHSENTHALFFSPTGTGQAGRQEGRQSAQHRAARKKLPAAHLTPKNFQSR